MFGKRLEILADRLESIAAAPVVGRGFNLTNWFEQDSCGTTACAMGEACLIPEFQELGLRLVFPNASVLGMPEFEGCPGFSAAAKFFDIPSEDAFFLFLGGQYSRRDDARLVANRIRAYVARGGRPPAGEEEFVPLCHTSGVNPVSTSGVSICPRV